MNSPTVITEFDRLTDKHLIGLLSAKKGTWRGVSLAALQYGAQTAEADCQPFDIDEYGDWRASRWVGAFGLDGHRWVIQARIGQWQFDLLARSVLAATVVNGGNRAISAKADGLDLLPLAWYVSFQNALTRTGFPKAYVPRSAGDCTELRGTLDLPRQLTENLASPQYLACQWDEVTHNNTINQTSRLTTAHLRLNGRFPFGATDSPAHHELNRWNAVMAHMGIDKPNGMQVDTAIRWSRANDAFRVPHQLAMWVLQNSGEVSGHTKSPAILIDSAEVWELYLRSRLYVIAKFQDVELTWPRSAEKDHLLKWEGSLVRGLIPDFTLRRKSGLDQTVFAVLDAKYRRYKSPAKDTLIAEQMAFYAITANMQHGQGTLPLPNPPTMVLIYPKSAGLNNGLRSGLIEEGNYLIQGEPKMFAWAIELLDKCDPVEFHSHVDMQLCDMLKQLN